MFFNRRVFLQGVGTCAMAALFPARGRGVSSKLTGKRPNIILIMTDDQGKGDLSCMGNPVLKTPNLDRLCSLSTRLTDFHVSPTCSPTRSAIMSGRHEFKNGVTHTILERERMALSTTTIAQVLQKADYATGIFGKWHLGDEEPYQPHNRGFDEVFIHGAGGIGQAYDCSCADAPPNRENRYFDCVIRHNAQLYDIKADPGETTNVIDKHPDAVAKMRAAYDAWWAEARPLIVNEDVQLASERPFWVLYEKQLKGQGIPKWEPPQL